MSAPATCEPAPAAGGAGADLDLAALPGLPLEGDAPVFRAPWEAQAFAMTLSLHRAGVFAWTEWAEALSARLAAAAEAGGAQDGTDYYLRWLEALEDIAVAKGAADADALAATDTTRQRVEATSRVTRVHRHAPCPSPVRNVEDSGPGASFRGRRGGRLGRGGDRSIGDRHQ